MLENRIDLDLQKQGSILLGRDDKVIMQNKREMEQMAMKQALERQIEEKRLKKEQELEKIKLEEQRDEARVHQEMRAMALAEGVPVAPTTQHQTFYENET